ncbi:MAG: metallophosphoesterase [Labilithrix sp.]|nr:metallophosphoesterase [Labilithrix sp.]
MRRIAHLSDVHMLDAQCRRRGGARYRFATKAVSLGRPVDPQARAKKLTRALRAAKASGADHVVITGDLTEVGDRAEFEHFADVLEDAKMPEGSVSLVPGNHDAYTSGSAWRRALEGPLHRFAAASAAEPGKIVDRGPVAFLPIDTTCFQSILSSGGLFTPEAARAVTSRIDDPALRDKAIVVVMHHPPFDQHRNPIAQWIDGLRGCAHVLDILAKHPRVQILHGHMHRVVDRIVKLGKARIFGAPAIVDDGDAPRVRLYDVRDGALESAGLFAM